MATFKVLHGGRVRWSGPVDTSKAYTAPDAWEKGNVLALQSDGYVRCVSAAADYQSAVLGLACENRTSASDTEVDAGGYASMVLDEAVVRLDQLASGVRSFEENQALYTSSDGHVTNQDPTSGLVIGKCLTALQSDGTIDMFFSVQY